ncbi:MAG: glutamate racemase [Patescibacteria group bacterium]
MLGIFDSGIGGLTVVKELLRRSPDAAFTYLGDTARTPYGTKGKETIIQYALEDAKFLVDRGAEAMIVACNTVSAYALPALHEQYPSLQIFDVLSPAIHAAISAGSKQIGVIGTSATIRSGAYEQALHQANPDLKVTSVACPLFVPLVEEGWIDDDITRQVVARYLVPLKELNIDVLILGCTHYPILQKLIAQEMGENVLIIDSPNALMNSIQMQFPHLLNTTGDQQYWFTDDQPSTSAIASRWLERNIEVRKANA